MCLISVCPKGTKKYSEEVTAFIKSGFESNGDGSGFMYKKDGDSQIYIHKGYWNLEKMMQAIKDANLNDADELVIHHRIGTAGLKSPENTHPFVLSHVHETVIMTHGKTTKPCLVHNGMFRRLDKFEKINPDFSDTYAFARYILVNSINLFRLQKETFLELYKPILGWSKLCVLFSDRDLIMSGDFTKDNGYYHSNAGYKNFRHRDVGGVSNNENFLGAGSVGTGANQLNLPLVITNKQPVVLDGNYIDINAFNCHHFVYQKKDITNPLVYKIERIDEGDTDVIMETGTEWKKISRIVSIEQLHSDYNFHPKKQYEPVYFEYSKLLAKLSPSKNVFKDIYRTLINNKNKPLFNTFKIKKIEVTRLTLINYYMSLVKNHMAHDSFYAMLKVSDLVSTEAPETIVSAVSKKLISQVTVVEDVSCNC